VDYGFDLSPLDPARGSRLLLHLLGNEIQSESSDFSISSSERQAAAALVKALGGLPLAISQVAGYCKARNVSLIQYWPELRREAATSHWMDGLASVGGAAYPYSLASVWDYNFARLSSDGMFCLGVLSHLPSERVPKALLLSPHIGMTYQRITDVLGVLSRSSLLIHPLKEEITMHRLV
jgi:hypothetical protein